MPHVHLSELGLQYPVSVHVAVPLLPLLLPLLLPPLLLLLPPAVTEPSNLQELTETTALESSCEMAQEPDARVEGAMQPHVPLPFDPFIPGHPGVAQHVVPGYACGEHSLTTAGWSPSVKELHVHPPDVSDVQSCFTAFGGLLEQPYPRPNAIPARETASLANCMAFNVARVRRRLHSHCLRGPSRDVFAHQMKAAAAPGVTTTLRRFDEERSREANTNRPNPATCFAERT